MACLDVDEYECVCVRVCVRVCMHNSNFIMHMGSIAWLDYLLNFIEMQSKYWNCSFGLDLAHNTHNVPFKENMNNRRKLHTAKQNETERKTKKNMDVNLWIYNRTQLYDFFFSSNISLSKGKIEWIEVSLKCIYHWPHLYIFIERIRNRWR